MSNEKNSFSLFSLSTQNSSLSTFRWSGREDLNFRPPAPKAGALPGCATPRQMTRVILHRKCVKSRLLVQINEHRQPLGQFFKRLAAMTHGRLGLAIDFAKSFAERWVVKERIIAEPVGSPEAEGNASFT